MSAIHRITSLLKWKWTAWLVVFAFFPPSTEGGKTGFLLTCSKILARASVCQMLLPVSRRQGDPAAPPHTKLTTLRLPAGVIALSAAAGETCTRWALTARLIKGNSCDSLLSTVNLQRRACKDWRIGKVVSFCVISSVQLVALWISKRICSGDSLQPYSGRKGAMRFIDPGLRSNGLQINEGKVPSCWFWCFFSCHL